MHKLPLVTRILIILWDSKSS